MDPIKPKLKPPGNKRLKLNCDVLLSTYAFKFNLRRYNKTLLPALVNCTDAATPEVRWCKFESNPMLKARLRGAALKTKIRLTAFKFCFIFQLAPLH